MSYSANIRAIAFNSPRISMREKKIFTVILIFAPIIRIYASYIPGINLFELLMLMVIIFPLLSGRLNFFGDRKNIGWYFMLMWFIFVLITCVSMICGIFGKWPTSSYDIIIRCLRWVFYIGVLCFSDKLLDKDLAIKLLKYTCIAVCTLLFIQIFWYRFTGEILTMKIPGWKLEGGFSTIDRQIAIAEKHVFRAYSVFLEPAHFSYFVLVGLMVMLFIDKKISYMIAAYYSLALFFCSSSSAIVLTFVIWMFYAYYLFFYVKHMEIGLKSVFLLIVLIVSFYFVIQLPEVQYGIDKILTNKNTLVVSSRTGKYKEYLSLMSEPQKLIGIGMGNEENFFKVEYGIGSLYMNTIGYLITNVGYIGLTIFGIVILLCLIKTPMKYKIFVLVFIVTNYFSGMLFSSNMIFFMVWPLVFGIKEK